MHYASCPDVAPKLEREPLRGPEMDLAAAGGVKRSVDADDLESAAVKFQKTEDGLVDAPLAQPYSGGEDDNGEGVQSSYGATAAQLPGRPSLGRPLHETQESHETPAVAQQFQPLGQPHEQPLGQPLGQAQEQTLGQLIDQPHEQMLGQPLEPTTLVQPLSSADDILNAQAMPLSSTDTAETTPIDLSALSPAQTGAHSFDLTNQLPAQDMPDVYNLTQFDGDELDVSSMHALDDGSSLTMHGEEDVETDFSITEKRRKSRMEVVDEPESGDRQIFTPYSCPKLPADSGAVPHCGEVVETSSLAAVEPPAITHKCLIPSRVIREGRLSDLQWEAVNYAGQRHSQFNKDGSRGGFMLGDGTGVGKGRTCAGVIYDFFMHQREEIASASNNVRPNRPIICVWVSVSWDLAQDATRDLSAITEPLDDQELEADIAVHVRRGPGVWQEANTLRPENDAEGSWWVSTTDPQGTITEELVAGEDIRASVLPVITVKDTQAASFNLANYMKSGLVIFATYSVFSRGDQSTGLTRLRQLLAPSGREYEFEGVVAFDEAHNAKNLVAGRGKASKTGLHVKKLQDDFESARIIYASATGASEVRNMGYMTRLGLWGEGTPFSDFAKIPPGKRNPAFLAELKRGGFGAMELVGMDLKAQGRYLCRTLSFRGATFDVHEANLGPEERKIYDEAASMWQRLIVICKNGRFWASIEGVNLKTFWAAQQLFFRQLLCAFKVKTTIKLIQKALDNDRSVIVGVQLTGDSRVQEMLKELMKGREDEVGIVEQEEGQGSRRSKASNAKPRAKKRAQGPGELEDAFSSTKETFTRLIENCWSQTENISIPEVRALRKGKSFVEVFRRTKIPQRNQPGHPNISEAQARRHKIWKDLADRADALKFPVNPIDGILQAFGPDNVAEVTGRRLRAELRANGRVEYVSRASGVPQAKLNLLEQRAFVNGSKRVIIISQAGSSGISLHAGFDYTNQQPRTHIILELPWSSEQLIQQCGRSHRSNQLSAPEFIAISTNVAGETRFAMSVAARMQSLGALTKSDRRAAHCTSEALSRFNFVTKHGRNALREVQCKTQVQALARLAGNASKQQQQQQQNIGALQNPAGALGQLSEQEKRNFLRKLGLHESATNKEMRDRFIARGIVCFVDRQMADREVKSMQAQASHQRGQRKYESLKEAEGKRGTAAKRLLEIKNAYEGVSGEQAIPIEWTPKTHSLFPSPVKRAIAEVLRVFKQKERELFSADVVSGLYSDGKAYRDKQFGRLPAIAIKNIFSYLAVGKAFVATPLVQPRPTKGQDAASFKASPEYKFYQEQMKKQQLVTQHAFGWLHPPEPAVELFCLLLLLDVVKAPTQRPDAHLYPTSDFDMGYNGNDKIENNLTIETFFNRMLAMSTTWQKRIFSYFMDLHENELADAEAAGESAALAGVTEVGLGRNCTAELKSEIQICVDRESGSAVMHLCIEVESADSRFSCRDAWRKLKECGELVHQGGSSVVREAVWRAEMGAAEGPKAGALDARGAVCGFYQQKRSKRIVMVVREERSTTYAIWRPNSRTAAERRRLTYRALCERLQRFDALSEATARIVWSKAWERLNDRTVETYHLITGPVLACWHVIKDCAARVTNEVDHNAAPEGQVEKEEPDKPDTTLSIVRAVLDDGRRIIGLQIEESNVEFVESELRRQHEIGWGESDQQEQPVHELGVLQGNYATSQPMNVDWSSTAVVNPTDSITVEGNQYGDNNHSLGSMPGVAGVAAAGCQGTSVFPHTQSQQPTTYNFTTDEW